MCRRLKQYLVGIYNTQHIDLYFVTFAIFSFAVHISFLNHLKLEYQERGYLYMTASVAVLRKFLFSIELVFSVTSELLSAHFPPVTTELPITDKLSVVQTAMNGCFSPYLCCFEQKQSRNCQRRGLFKDSEVPSVSCC